MSDLKRFLKGNLIKKGIFEIFFAPRVENLWILFKYLWDWMGLGITVGDEHHVVLKGMKSKLEFLDSMSENSLC